MYLALLVLFTVVGIGLLVKGQGKRHSGATIAGGILLALTALVFGTLSFWGELLWYRSLGYDKRFWKVVLAEPGFGLLGALIGFVVVYLLTLPIPRDRRMARIWPELAGAAVGGLAGFQSWEIILVFFNRVSAGIADPILGRDAGFYLFTLPLYDRLNHLLLVLAAIALAAAGAAMLLRPARDDEYGVELHPLDDVKELAALRIPLTALLLILAWGQVLDRYHLMTSRLGIVAGPGWADAHVRMPGYTIVGWLCVLCAILLLISPLRRRLAAAIERRGGSPRAAALAPFLLPPAAVAVAGFLLLAVAPLLAQWLLVEPNEITRERNYIEHNIRFTRHGFGMADVEEREFPATGQFTRQTIEDNRDLMSEIRLWDWRALAEVYEQFQEIRLYYTFTDVDIDRYTIGDKYRQVMVSPREMDLGSLAVGSQTFVNERFKYTHGYGLTMAPVREFTPEGLPNLLIKDIPPKVSHPSLAVDRPEIYYGELTHTPVVVNTKEMEFDYPSGETNAYTRYQGRGGVELSSLWRKFVYGWMFDGTRFLLSGYPTPESRVLFRRQVLERTRHLAPFLTFESDPYIVLNKGRLYWIIDAYTTSSRYPYSEPFWPPRGSPAALFRGANYVRNSVKVVVDAYQGDVSFYVFEPDDPVVKVWQNIFPELFKGKDEMPAGLRAHVRYPSSYLLAQGLVYTKYHMTDPAVFYNQEDLWVRATEKYYQNVQPVEPYYVMWKLPGTNAPQFSLILPFTPKNKQVMIGWMAGLCDGENYGRLLTYQFPKEKRFLGPQQVETKIDQDRDLSGQLTLWDQRGSKVIRGNVLAIPIDGTLLYVEPIYLQAETSAYPELRLVAVMQGDNLSYAETFDEAIEGLFDPTRKGASVAPSAEKGDLAQKANDAFNAYLRLQGEGRFAEAAAELETLRSVLEQLVKEKKNKGDAQ